MRKISLFLVTLLLSTVVSITESQSDELTIIASHSILADVIANVAGDVASVETLIPVGADPHAFQPSSGDLARLASADIVFINGGLLEEGLLDTIENVVEETPIIIASSCIEVRLFEDEEEHEHEDEEEHENDHEGEHQHEDEEEHENDHEGEHQHEDEEESHSEDEALHNQCDGYYDELGLTPDIAKHRLYELDCGDNHEEHEEDSGEHDHHSICDPHVWTVPQNVMLWALYIRDVLSEANPSNVGIYQTNASDYIEQLQDLEGNFIQPELERIPAENRILITNHDSLGYFADAYNFEIVSTVISGGSTIAEVSTASIVDVIEQINITGISAIFTETTMSEDIAQQIANETGAEIYQLYSGALGQEGSPASTYIDYMRYNVSTIVNALAENQ